MARLRQIDRAILSEVVDNAPMDSEDQELLISSLALSNNSSRTFFTRALVLSILIEIPISVHLVRRRAALLLLVSNSLTMVGCLYDFAGHTRMRDYLRSIGCPDKLRQCVQAFLSFKGLFMLNTVVLLQLMYVVQTFPTVEVWDIFLLLPVVNLVTGALIRKWHSDVSSDIDDLHSLKYKFKTA